jgi:hypothetical protein
MKATSIPCQITTRLPQRASFFHHPSPPIQETNMTIASDSLTQHRNLSYRHHHHTKEFFMKFFRHFLTLALFALAPASAFAVTSLGVNITVTITSSNAVEWSFADGNANVTGQREWVVTGAAVNTAYLSTTQGTITGPAGGTPAIATQATALNFTNKGNISITSSVTVANGTQWNFGGAAALDVFMLEAYTDGGTTPIATKVSGSALSLLTTQAKDAVCNFALRITTPTSVSGAAKLSSAQVATILSTQN